MVFTESENHHMQNSKFFWRVQNFQKLLKTLIHSCFVHRYPTNRLEPVLQSQNLLILQRALVGCHPIISYQLAWTTSSSTPSDMNSQDDENTCNLMQRNEERYILLILFLSKFLNTLFLIRFWKLSLFQYYINYQN